MRSSKYGLASAFYNKYESCNIKPVSGNEYVVFNSSFNVYPSPTPGLGGTLGLYGGLYSGSIPIGDVYIDGSGIDWNTGSYTTGSGDFGWQFCIAPTPAEGDTWIASGPQCHVAVRYSINLFAFCFVVSVLAPLFVFTALG